jgi:hypothetical protein
MTKHRKLTPEEEEEIAWHQLTARVVELGLMEVVGRDKDGAPIYRRTEVQLTDDQLFDALKQKH